MAETNRLGMGGLTGHVLELYGGDAPQFLDATRRTGRVRKPVGMPITEASRVPWGRIASRERGGDAVCADGSQRVDLQRDALAAAGVPSEAVYEDRASGKRDGRPGLEACLKALRCGDTLVVWKLDRLGRDLAHLVGVVSGLAERKIGLRVLTGQGAAISTPVRPADVSCSESSRLSRSSSANSFASEHAQVWRRPEPGGERVDASSP